MPEEQKRHIVVGTAGHIDHGKSALIKALTGVDPDRLKEEKERGMTTDLGFVFYGDDVTIIDVPGHEKFIRHMVAGASTLDFVIFVVAADDGVMPQTVEHLEILKLLEIQKGFIAITKKDLVDDELLQLVIEDVKRVVKGTFLENTPIIPVSNTTKQGFDRLKEVLDELITQTQAKKDKGIFRLPIDRCFSIKGFGTVVAGTVLSGSIKTGDTLELLPRKKQVKVRGIQVHNHKVDTVSTGYRAAINIVGADKDEINRGDTLGQIGYFQPSEYINASIHLLSSSEKPLKNLIRLRIHLETKEIFGRVVLLDTKVLKPGEKAMVQFRLEEPAVTDVGDRYVVRTYSPQNTIGGGVIIEPKAQKAKGFDEDLIAHLQKIEEGDPTVMVEENLLSNFNIARKIDEIALDLNLPLDKVRSIVEQLIEEHKVVCIDKKRGLYYAMDNIQKLMSAIEKELKQYHAANSTNIGMPQLELQKSISRGLDKILYNHVTGRLVTDKKIKTTADNKVSLFNFTVKLDKQLDDIGKKINDLFVDARFKPPDLQTVLAQHLGLERDVQKAYKYLIESGTLIDVGESVVFHKKFVEDAQNNIIAFLKKNKEIKVSEFRDMIGASRKYALPLLIYFDTHNVTIKRGEVRLLGQKYR
ncbi:MAG: selenocysteine-specific translation elongation factor [candidate division WOR-3 bacterium]|nr:MAG: selenocysteine-specific translation elongation factor [candidate division WOR-3 bacterium]